jgi:uncharacterized coiled-coil protein SlyX
MTTTPKPTLDERIAEMQAALSAKDFEITTLNHTIQEMQGEIDKLREAVEVALAYCTLKATWRPVNDARHRQRLEKALERK